VKRRSFLTLTGAGLTVLATSQAHAAPAREPRIVVLDTLPNGYGSVRALGRPGLAGGQSDQVPVYWTGRTVHRIPLPPRYEGSEGQVNAINRHGLMVGTLRPGGGPDVGFRYRPGWPTARILPDSTSANDVNDHGRIVGSGPDQWTALVWHGNTVERELMPPPFSWVSGAVGINNAGTIVANALGALIWPAGTTGPAQRLLPSDFPEGESHSAAAIDEHGRVVGSYMQFFSDSQQEIYWDPPYTSDGVRIPGLPGFPYEGYFEAISPTTGLIVGGARTNFVPPEEYPPGVAEFWTGEGPIQALPRLTEDSYSYAYAAADNGRVGGEASQGDRIKPVIWTGVR
jgi:hypothetical protein